MYLGMTGFCSYLFRLPAVSGRACSDDVITGNPPMIGNYDGTVFVIVHTVAKDPVLRRIFIEFIDSVRTNRHIACQ